MLERDLLRAVLVDHVVVRHRQRVGEAEVDLLLARPRLALRRLHAHPGRVHVVAQRPQQRLVVRRAEDVVVEDVRDARRQLRIAPRVRLRVGLPEEVELELGAHHRSEPERRGPLHLRLQHLARRGLHGGVVVPEDVGEHERCALEPGDAPQGREVGDELEVAVALLPARDLVARHRVHLHLECEQVVAALGPVPGRRSARGRTRRAAACPSAGPACR